MRDRVVETVSAGDARAEAERHRQDLAQTLAILSERVGGVIGEVEKQITLPLRWTREHPLAALGISVAAGALLSRGRMGGVDGAHPPPLSRELEGAYLLGRRDEAQQMPTRNPDYWLGAARADGGGEGFSLGGLLLAAAKPLVGQLAKGLTDSLQGHSHSE